MKWFRITSLGWQIAIIFAVVILLTWESMPVPGPDGRIVVELYEVRADPSLHKLPWVAFQAEWADDMVFGKYVPVVKWVKRDPNKWYLWLRRTSPFIANLLPAKYRFTADGSWFVVVSLTPEEWKQLRDERKESSRDYGSSFKVDGGPGW